MVVAAVFDVAATAAGPVLNVGWTPTTTMGLITNIIAVGLGGGALKVFANHLLSMRKIADARATQVDARGDAQNIALSSRVSELEKALSDERRECDKQLAEMRGELREMQVKIDGFVRQLIAFQTSEARAMTLSPAMSRAMGSLDTIQGTGETGE